MISYIRLLLDYGAYPVFLYDDEGCVIDTDLPPEWRDDGELVAAFDAVDELYVSFFIDDEHEFSYVGPRDEETKQRFIALVERAVSLLETKNAGKYTIIDDITGSLAQELDFQGDKR